MYMDRSQTITWLLAYFLLDYVSINARKTLHVIKNPLRMANAAEICTNISREGKIFYKAIILAKLVHLLLFIYPIQTVI